MVARYEPDGNAPPPAEAEPLLGRSDEQAVARALGARSRAGRLPVVVVDRLEDLDGTEAPAFRADARAVHLEREPEQ